MHTPLVIGSYAFFAATWVCVAVFFIRAWLARREDREFLVFGVLSLSLAVHSVITATIFATAIGMVSWSTLPKLFNLIVYPSKASVALTFHFALLYAKVKRADQVALPIYVLMAAFCVLGLADGWWAHIGNVREVTFFGLSLHRADLAPSEAAQPFYLVVPVLLGACIYLLGRTYMRSRAGVGAWVGSLFLGASIMNDIGLGAGLVRTLPMFAPGFLVFTYGVALTLVSRYARTASELQTNTSSLRDRSRELELSYSDLHRTQQDLVRSEQLAVIGELAAVIAHEVRNPLAIVGNAVASLRKRHTTRDDRRMLLEIINEEMGRLDRLVGRLIHYARPVVLDRQVVALDSLVEQSAKVLEGSGIRVDVEECGPSSYVEGDRELLRKVFENLLSNAAQASGASTVIRARFDHRSIDGMPVVAAAISDSGDGMSPEQLGAALTPFFTTRPTGTGLGLPIVARIVEAHGGKIELDSKLGEGTTVTVILPTEVVGGASGAEDDRKPISLLP